MHNSLEQLKDGSETASESESLPSKKRRPVKKKAKRRARKKMPKKRRAKTKTVIDRKKKQAAARAAAKTEKKPNSGLFKKGNKVWKKAKKTKFTRPFAYDDPEELWTEAMKYLDWVESTPLYKTEVVKQPGNVELVSVPLMRTPTLVGLSAHLGITLRTWTNYRIKENLSECVALVEQIITQIKFEGAAAGLLNAGLISKDLGQIEKTESVSDTLQSSYENMTYEEAREAYLQNTLLDRSRMGNG